MHQLIKYIRNASHLGLMRLQNCIDVKTKDENKKIRLYFVFQWWLAL